MKNNRSFQSREESKQPGHMARGNPSRERSCGAEMSKRQKQAGRQPNADWT